jgi:hypothetical protein
VQTAFHEFGHALHGFLSQCNYVTVSGTNVARDFVEMFSQFNENFAFVPEILVNYANNWETGEPIPASLVEKIRKSLNSWGNKHISFGGKLVLINSVLNSIPIFYMSYMKMPVQVRKKVVRIQRDFLWGGVNGKKKLSWVKWKVVCQDKKKGGLGVRDLELVNLSLLMKWRWRLLNREEVGLWKDVLIAKYGDFILHNASWSNRPYPYFASNWWKDICDLEGCVESKNWVAESVSRTIGNGATTQFWSEKWIGDSLLCVKFPRLFLISNQKEATISELAVVEGGIIHWNFSWRRRLFV